MAPFPFQDKVVYGKTIRKENSYDAESYTYYPVVIIGAGESGIGMGCRLKEVLGFDQFRIFERQSGVGGTWWINRYPGVACDIPAVFYSFSFCPNPNWSHFFPEGREISEYLQNVCNTYKITDQIQLNTDVTECRWLESEQVWEVTLQHLVSGVGDLPFHDRAQKIKDHGPHSVYTSEEKIRAKVLISAVGGIVEPHTWPKDIPGKDKFEGEIFHSARWNHDIDLKNKDVIVVGSGCSAAQFVPELTKKYGAKSVTQVMRSPPWVVPRIVPPGGDKGWVSWAPWLSNNIPGFNKIIRTLLFVVFERDFRLFGGKPYHAQERAKAEAKLLKHLKATVPEKYHSILTPNYGLGCKRRIYDAAWFKSLNEPAIEITTLPLTSLGTKSVILGPGRAYPPSSDTSSMAPTHERTLPADVIVLANGFETTLWLHPVKVIGRNGVQIHDVWKERGGPQMYMGAAMDGFPNFFTIFGPNTATGHTSVIFASETMIDMTLKFIKPVLAGDVQIVEVKKEAELGWAKEIQGALKQMVFGSGGCRNWYVDETGWNSATYPYSMYWFTFKCMFPTWSHWNMTYTRKGLLKIRLRRVIKTLALIAGITGAIRFQRSGNDLRTVVKDYLRLITFSAASVLYNAGAKI